MAERLWIAEGYVAAEGKEFQLLAYIDTDEEKGRFTTHVEVRDPAADKSIGTSDVEFEISNPIDAAAIAITAGTAYGSCIAWRMTRYSMKVSAQCYRDSKKAKPKLSRSERVKDVAACVASKGADYKKELQNATIDCVPFKDIFTDDGGGDPPPKGD